MKLEPYLFFEGRCEEAINFYVSKLGAKVQMVMKYKDSPECPPGGFPAEMKEKVMHGSLSVGEAHLMVSDGHCKSPANFSGFTLSLMTSSVAEAERLFAALGEGGKVGMPLAKTFFSPSFGMVTDKFGVPWMVLAQG